MSFSCRHQRRWLCGLTALLACLAGLLHSANAQFCTPTPGSCWPSRAAFATWMATLSNSTNVYNPDTTPDIFFSEATSMNLLKSTFPGLIVVPGTESDLRSSMLFASKNRIRVVARCSGHDFNGRSNGRGVMLIKTEKLNWVTYDNATQTVSFGSGANHADIYGALVPYNRVYVGGQSKTVCPAGCLSGGCHGFLSRQYGLGIDSIVSIRLALFNGTVITASRTRFADLFHAYLGAGANSFGVALSFKARTYPAPPAVIMFDGLFSIVSPNAPQGATEPNVYSAFFLNTTWFDSMPRELAGNIITLGGSVQVKLVYTGADYDGLTAALAPLLASEFLLGADEPRVFANLYDVALDLYPPASEIWARKFITSGFLQRDQQVLDGVAATVAAAQPNMWMWFVFGGAVPEQTTGSVPGGMRTAMYEVLFGDQWVDPTEDRDHVEGLEPLLPVLYQVTSASYSNEFTAWSKYNNVPDWQTRFFSNYSQLLAVKKKYDPCNLMTARFAVGSDQPTAICNCAPKG